MHCFIRYRYVKLYLSFLAWVDCVGADQMRCPFRSQKFFTEAEFNNLPRRHRWLDLCCAIKLSCCVFPELFHVCWLRLNNLPRSCLCARKPLLVGDSGTGQVVMALQIWIGEVVSSYSSSIPPLRSHLCHCRISHIFCGLSGILFGYFVGINAQILGFWLNQCFDDWDEEDLSLMRLYLSSQMQMLDLGDENMKMSMLLLPFGVMPKGMCWGLRSRCLHDPHKEFQIVSYQLFQRLIRELLVWQNWGP